MFKNINLSVIFLETNCINKNLVNLQLYHGMTNMEHYFATKMYAVDKFFSAIKAINHILF